MKKLLKKKVKLFGKEVSVFLIVMIAMVGLGSAALVPYLSGMITGTVTVSAPMEITMTGISRGTFNNGLGTFNVALSSGQSFELNTITTNEGDTSVDDLLIEVKVADFDGEGIDYFHSDCQEGEIFGAPYSGEGFCWKGNIPVCTDGTDAYYYIGPAEGFTAEADYEEETTSTITTSLYLEPDAYVATIGVITIDKRACVP